jgi:hypothetical protein
MRNGEVEFGPPNDMSSYALPDISDNVGPVKLFLNTFSSPAGAPIIRNFLDRSREFYAEPTSSMDGRERERFFRVFTFKRSIGAGPREVRH